MRPRNVILYSIGLIFVAAAAVFLLRGKDQAPSTATPPHIPLPRRAISDRSPTSCHDGELKAPSVAMELATGEVPSVSGGALRDGVYNVKRYRVFGSVPERALARPFSQTIYIENNGTTARNVRIGVHDHVESSSWSASVSGNEMTWVGVCPEAIRGTREVVRFEAAADRFSMLFEQMGAPVVVTYERASEPG